MKDFRNTTVYVVGGTSGIGFGLAECLVKLGARVGILGSNSAKLAQAEAQLRGAGGRVAARQLDVREEAAWPGAMADLEQAIGPPDSLLLNAGVGCGSTPIESGPSSLWRWIWEVNVLGTVYGLRACLPGMRSRGRPGYVLITSSVAALLHPPGLGPYTVTKAALVGIAGTLREELRDTPIRVGVLIPASVKTDLGKTSERQAPSDFRSEAAKATFSGIDQMLQSGLEPLDVARFTLERLVAGAFFICTHADGRAEVAAEQLELLRSIPSHAPLSVDPGSD